MASGWNNGNLIVDPGAVVDAFNSIRQNGTVRATFGYQQSSSSGKVSFGNFGTNDTIIFDATGGKYKGYAANTAPAAGFIGEHIKSSLGSGSAVSLVSTTAKTVTSISLTAGIWDVTTFANFIAGVGSTTSQTAIGISSVDNTIPTAGDAASIFNTLVTPPSNFGPALSVPSLRVSLNATTTYYMVAVCQFTGTMSVYGRISATRVA